MSSNAKNIKIVKYEDLFESSEPVEPSASTAGTLKIADMHPFRNHPFKLYNEEKMQEMVESVQQNGVIMPILVRPMPEGMGYEIVSGHNRVEAAKRAGLEAVPANIREMDDETAIIIMVDSNLRQREKLLPSEKAFAYKMKLDALNRKAGRPSQENLGQVVPNYLGKRSTEIIGEQSGESYKQIQRYIRLTELIPGIMDWVDEGKIAFNPAVNLSHLDRDQQCWLQEIMESEQCTPSLSQAERLRDRAKQGKLDYSSIETIMTETKPQQEKFVLKTNIYKYFPKDTSPSKMEEIIIKLLDNWHKKQLEKRETERF